jgi:lipoprotein-releasing system permease protein
VTKKIWLPFTYFVALRYLKPKRTFLSLITLISILGVVLGISVLIIVISVMTGYERELQRKIIGFDAHIFIKSDDAPIADWRRILDQTVKTPGVVAATPYVMGRVIAEFQNRRLAPYIRAIDPQMEGKVADLKQFIVEGALDLDGDSCVIGSELAHQLRLQVGDTLQLYSPNNISQILDELDQASARPENKDDLKKIREMVLPTELQVTGIFKSGRYAYDSDIVLLPLFIGQELYSLGDAVHGLNVKTTDPFTAQEVRDRLNRFLEPPIQAITWMDLNQDLFDAIRTERVTMFFVLIFVVIVAAFGIMSTLITTTVQKTREIGVMKALGARVTQILGIFLAQGLIVGCFGTLIGLASGILMVQYRNEVRDFLSNVTGIPIFQASVYQFSQIPAEIVPTDVAIICISGFLICSIAALIPAYFAARLDPVKALRYE